MLPVQAEDLQQQIIRETFHLVSKRDDNVCNFLEGGTYVPFLYESFRIKTCFRLPIGPGSNQSSLATCI